MAIDGYSFNAAADVQAATPFEGWIDTIERRIDVLRETHDRVMLIGISAGASLALGAAIRCGSRVDALVLMSTTLQFDGWAVPSFHMITIDNDRQQVVRETVEFAASIAHGTA